MTRENISEYLQGCDFSDDKALEFLIPYPLRMNISYEYIVKKIISQLGVRNHINRWDTMFKTSNGKEILEQIINRREPSLMKRIIQMDTSEEYKIKFIDANDMIVSPLNQMEYGFSSNQELSIGPYKNNFFQNFIAKFFQKKAPNYIDRPLNNSEKFINIHYLLPQEIMARQGEISSLKWYEIGKKINLSREIRELQNRKSQFLNDILQYAPTDYCIGEESVVKKWWEDFYTSHEKEMLDFIDSYMKTNMRTNLSTKEEKEALSQSLSHYLTNISGFQFEVDDLKRDICCHFNLLREVFLKDHSEQDLFSTLKDIRETMSKNHISKERISKEFRNDTLSPVNNFFQMTSKGDKVDEDMDELSQKYEELKNIEDREEYIECAVDIYVRFLQIHPYGDGNGRTSRSLLDIMLINRNILPPVLYDTYYDRGILDKKVMEYITGSDRNTLTKYIKEKIRNTPGNEESSVGENIRSCNLDIGEERE